MQLPVYITNLITLRPIQNSHRQQNILHILISSGSFNLFWPRLNIKDYRPLKIR